MDEPHFLRFPTGRQITAAVLRGWPVFLTVPYAVAACGLIAFYHAPLSRFLGLAPGDASVVLDFAILVALPIGLILWRVLRRHGDRRRSLREHFLADHAQDRLLASRYAPQNLYRVTGGDPETGRIEVLPVWDVDGPIAGARAYLADTSAFVPLVRDRFLAG